MPLRLISPPIPLHVQWRELCLVDYRVGEFTADVPNAADKFLWGATVCAHAVEGRDFDSDWWRWEQRPGRIAGGATSERGADHLARYREDLNLAQKFGLNGLQYSISWARVQPKAGQFDDGALAHYAAVFSAMRAKGITPIAVLQEHSLPAWFAEQGAWDHPGAPDLFAAYLERVYDALGPHCRHWLPHFEPILWQRLVFGEGCWPRPAKSGRGILSGISCLVPSHRRAWDFLKAQDARNEIGLSISAAAHQPADPYSPWDLRASNWQRHLSEQFLPRALSTRTDAPLPFSFIAVSVPGRQHVHFAPTRPHNRLAQYEDTPGVPSFADTGRSDAPALAEALGRISVWGVPLLVTGAGMPTDDDAERCSYLLDQVQAIEACRLRGVPILGFCYRSLLDGFEWRHGLTRRYGLIHVDRETLARTPNPSAFLYQDIARNGGIRPGAVARYCPAWHTPAKEAS